MSSRSSSSGRLIGPHEVAEGAPPSKAGQISVVTDGQPVCQCATGGVRLCETLHSAFFQSAADFGESIQCVRNRDRVSASGQPIEVESVAEGLTGGEYPHQQAAL